MYTKITKEVAKEVAHTLARVNHFGYATVVIDEHWETDYSMHVSSPDNSKGLLNIYECLDNSIGFVVNDRVEIPPDEDKIAAYLMRRINECIQEWEEDECIQEWKEDGFIN